VDKRIIIILIALVLILGSIFMIRIFTKSCETPEFSFSPQRPKAGEEVIFTSSNNSGKKMFWDFGDSDTTGSSAGKHVYKTAKTYSVIGKTEDGCESDIKQIVVDEQAKERIMVKPVVIGFPKKTEVGDEIIITDNTKDAEKWVWTILGSRETFTGKTLNYKFKRSGQFKIALAIEGKWVYGVDTLTLVVNPKTILPPPQRHDDVSPHKKDPPPPPPNNGTFASKFVEISNLIINNSTRNEASDRWRDEIMSQGCDNDMNVVIVNNDGKPQEPMALDLFKRNLIYGQYKLVVSVAKDRIVRNQKKMNCIIRIEVVVEK
jgi:hypothetical protein